MSMDFWWNDADGKTKVLGKKPVPVPLCPLVWDGTWDPVVRDQQLSTPWHRLNTVYITSVCVCSTLSVFHTCWGISKFDCNSMST